MPTLGCEETDNNTGGRSLGPNAWAGKMSMCVCVCVRVSVRESVREIDDTSGMYCDFPLRVFDTSAYVRSL